MDALDQVFKLFFYKICDVAKWIFAIKIATNIIKHSESSDWQNIFKDLINGGFSYGALFSIVSILDQVKNSIMR